VKSKHGLVSSEEEFDRLLKAVKDATPQGAYRTVFLHFLMDHFGKAPSFDWYRDKEELQEALDYNLIRVEGNETWINWSEKKMQKLSSAIDELTEFLASDESEEYTNSLDEDIPTEPSNKGFWEYHLDL
jgi:hypothetical protein